jgi:hypothetical protein
MQAMVRITHRFGFDRIKVALVAVGILTSTIIGAAAVYQRDGGSETRQSVNVQDERAGTAHLEANGLPVAPNVVSDRSSGTEHLEANGLPVAPMVAVAQSGGTGSLEANGLPVAPAVSPTQSADTAYLEANGLPIVPALPNDLEN